MMRLRPFELVEPTKQKNI